VTFASHSSKILEDPCFPGNFPAHRVADIYDIAINNLSDLDIESQTW
jgi:hypothetical protein